jgi:hypothetical protein
MELMGYFVNDESKKDVDGRKPVQHSANSVAMRKEVFRCLGVKGVKGFK